MSFSGNRSDEAFAPSGGPYSSNRTLRVNFNAGIISIVHLDKESFQFSSSA